MFYDYKLIQMIEIIYLIINQFMDHLFHLITIITLSFQIINNIINS